MISDKFAAAVAIAGDTIAAVTSEQMTNPTPCTDFDARAMIGHLTGMLDRTAALGNATDPFAAPGVVEGIPDEERPVAWAESAARTHAAWADDAVLERIITMPWAALPGAAMLATFINEVTVHTWDLAVATGQSPAWNDEVNGLALFAMKVGLPAEGRKAAYEEALANTSPEMKSAGQPFGEVVPVSEDAPPIDQLVAYNGRDPRQ